MNFRSYVISWNVTRLCNERCQHCYIHASPYADRSDELSTDECFRVVDQIREVSPGALIILTGGEPLLRKDIFEISRYATDAGFMCVMGTNGILITGERAQHMQASGIRGVSISLDSIHPEVHDAFRGYAGAWRNSVKGIEVLDHVGLPFLIQTTVTQENLAEIPQVLDLGHKLGAKVLNLYFLVPTGRGAFMSNITPEQYESLMHELLNIQPRYRGEMLINAKCAPHFQRVLWESDHASPYLKTYVGAGGCPAGAQYMGIRPNGDMTPCPYLPVYGGNLRTSSFADIWNNSHVFQDMRARKQLGGKCGPCEFNTMCGGCRARAYGALGDYMAEDPWCVYQPGQYGLVQIESPKGEAYGITIDYQLSWTPEARQRTEAIPAFVRGMVVKQVEGYARQHGYAIITPELMAEVKEKVIGNRVAGVPSFLRKP